MALKQPRLVNQGNALLAAVPTRIKIPDGTYTYGLAVGSLLLATGGAYVGGDTDAKYFVHALYDQYGRPVLGGYLTPTELDASDHYADVYDISAGTGVELEIGEDGDGGVIAAWATTPYVNLIVAEPTDINNNVNPHGEAVPNIQIDSSTANASASGKNFQIVRGSSTVERAGSTNQNYIVKAV